MLQVDLHSHSHFSQCGIHSVIEMLTAAKARGLAGLAITDHGPALHSSLRSTFFDRLSDPVAGIRLLKGIECNLGLTPGSIDLPERHLPFLDVILLGIHPNTPAGLDAEAYTDLLIAAMRANTCIDLITHTNSVECPVNFARLAGEAARLSVALEINNSKTALARVPDSTTLALIQACKAAGCRVAVCSDAHALNEIGCDEAVRPLLASAGFPESLVVNRDAATAFAWVDARRKRRA
jgi:histidinol phosphatase-like PHP family hydrolase